MVFWLDKDGKRQRAPRYFKRYEDSLAEAARIWEEHYIRFPDRNLAVRWTGNDSPDTWLANVKHYYETL